LSPAKRTRGLRRPQASSGVFWLLRLLWLLWLLWLVNRVSTVGVFFVTIVVVTTRDTIQLALIRDLLRSILAVERIAFLLVQLSILIVNFSLDACWTLSAIAVFAWGKGDIVLHKNTKPSREINFMVKG
jgi:hypothetical protein